MLLLRQMRRTVEAVEAAHRARGELLQAARLARVVTGELVELEARAVRTGAQRMASGNAVAGPGETLAGLLQVSAETGHGDDRPVIPRLGYKASTADAEPGLDI